MSSLMIILISHLRYFRPPSSPSPPAAEEFIRLTDETSCEHSGLVVVGSMVQLETVTGDKMCGVVRYMGDIPPRPGHWVGVEMEEEVRGGHNGWMEVCNQQQTMNECLPSLFTNPDIFGQTFFRSSVACTSNNLEKLLLSCLETPCNLD